MSSIGTPNPLDPAAGASTPVSGPKFPDPGPIGKAVGMAHTTAKAQYQKLAESSSRLDDVRQQLDRLQGMGDAVEQDDVIKAAGLLVGKGLSPMAMAGLLADMPEGGEALTAWVAQQAQQVTQREQQLAPLKSGARQALGSAALHSLALDHVQKMVDAAQRPGPTPPPASPGNMLAPTNG